MKSPDEPKRKYKNRGRYEPGSLGPPGPAAEHRPRGRGNSKSPMRAAQATEFGRRVRAAMLKAGFKTQSDLARKAQQFLPDGQTFGRDLISNYVNGNNMPLEYHLNAMCRALNVKPEDLVPNDNSWREDANPPLDIRTAGDGSVWIRVNQRTTLDVAMKIMALLNEAPKN